MIDVNFGTLKKVVAVTGVVLVTAFVAGVIIGRVRKTHSQEAQAAGSNVLND